MPSNKDRNGRENASMGEDKQMFDTLFREELNMQKGGAQGEAPPEAITREIEAKKEDSEPPGEGEPSETLTLSTAERRILKIKPGLDDEDDSVKSFEAEEDKELQELIDTSPIWRYREDIVKDASPVRDVEPSKRSHRLRTALLALLLLALGAFYITNFGVVDLGKFVPLSEWKPSSVVKHQVVRKPAIPPTAEEKTSPKPSALEAAVERPVVVMDAPEPPASTAPATPVENPVDVREPSDTRAPKPEAVSENIAAETAPLKETSRNTQPPKWIEGSYPYSVYLGSYATHERLHKAVNDFGSGGFLPYWVQVDLEKKGVWFRLFTGAFKTREEADGFIKEHQIDGALSRHTKYAVLIGTYRSAKQLNMERMELGAMGHSSYEVKGEKVFGLFSGAFFQVARAQKHKESLASKGIRGEVVER
jgi:cell division septation protein DedD